MEVDEDMITAAIETQEDTYHVEVLFTQKVAIHVSEWNIREE